MKTLPYPSPQAESLSHTNPKYAAYFFVAGHNKGSGVLASTRIKDLRSGSCYICLDLKRKIKMVPCTFITAKYDILLKCGSLFEMWCLTP